MNTHELKAAKVLFTFHILSAPFMKPVAHKKTILMCAKKCVPERFGAKKTFNLPDLFIIGSAKNKSVFGRDA